MRERNILAPSAQSFRPSHRVFSSIFYFLVVSNCGGGGAPSSPSTNPPPPAPAPTFTLRGQVSEAPPFSSNRISGARVEIVDGANAGKNATTDASGNYAIANVSPGGFTVRASADGFQSFAVGVTLNADFTQNFQLSPSAPRTRFGPGQYRVNSDIAPGRYFSDPAAGCYWERQRGLGGTLSDVIANEFVGFNAAQWIVDILPSDLAFETDGDCGTWFNTPRHGMQTTITPGMWLVGPQVSPGTYSAATRDGCYWERLRDFTGTIGGIIANDFVSGGGARLVSIAGSDLGFSTDDDCGPWTRSSSLTLGSLPSRSQSQGEIERHRHLNREQNGLPPKTWR